MRLDDIGFHGITEERALGLARSLTTCKIKYCEHIVTGHCNFNCSYCNILSHEDDPTTDQVFGIIDLLSCHHCAYYHITGGEPTIRPDLIEIVRYAVKAGMLVRLSTNGSAPIDVYNDLMRAGCLSYSISLDTNKEGERQKDFNLVVKNIRNLVANGSEVHIGTVFDKENIDEATEIVRFIATLGVADIKIGTASQSTLQLDLKGIEGLLRKHKVLKYRLERFSIGRGMRGLVEGDCNKCFLALDDLTIKGNQHYPCAVYLREGGKPIGDLGKDLLEQRRRWVEEHNSLSDPICRKFCMDFKCDFNNRIKGMRLY